MRARIGQERDRGRALQQVESSKGALPSGHSRGTKPDEAVAPAVRSDLAAEGIDVSAWRPPAISEKDIQLAARVVLIATDALVAKPSVKTKLIEWNDVPLLDQNYAVARKAVI